MAAQATAEVVVVVPTRVAWAIVSLGSKPSSLQSGGGAHAGAVWKPGRAAAMRRSRSQPPPAAAGPGGPAGPVGTGGAGGAARAGGPLRAGGSAQIPGQRALVAPARVFVSDRAQDGPASGRSVPGHAIAGVHGRGVVAADRVPRASAERERADCEHEHAGALPTTRRILPRPLHPLHFHRSALVTSHARAGSAAGRRGRSQPVEGAERTASSVATSPSRSCAVASATRPTPSSRAVADVTGPIETPRTPARSCPGERLGEARDGGRRGERHGVGREHALRVPSEATRACGRAATTSTSRARGAQAVGQACRAPPRRAPRGRARRQVGRQRLEQALRQRALGDDVGDDPHLAQRRGGARADGRDGRRRRARARRRRSARAAAAGRSARSRRRGRRRRASIGAPAIGSMRMTAHSSTSAPRSRSRATRPLAWARARVTTIAPAVQRPRARPSASSPRSAATAPITVTAGERMPAACDVARRSSRASRRRCAARPSCPTASRRRASRAPCRRRSAPRRPRRGAPTPMSTTSVPGSARAQPSRRRRCALPGRSCAVTIVTCAARSRWVTGTPA